LKQIARLPLRDRRGGIKLNPARFLLPVGSSHRCGEGQQGRQSESGDEQPQDSVGIAWRRSLHAIQERSRSELSPDGKIDLSVAGDTFVFLQDMDAIEYTAYQVIVKKVYTL